MVRLRFKPMSDAAAAWRIHMVGTIAPTTLVVPTSVLILLSAVFNVSMKSNIAGILQMLILLSIIGNAVWFSLARPSVGWSKLGKDGQAELLKLCGQYPEVRIAMGYLSATGYSPKFRDLYFARALVEMRSEESVADQLRKAVSVIPVIAKESQPAAICPKLTQI